MDSIRQQIIDAIDTRLKTIKVSGGYETDMGLQVFWWRDTTIQQAELPTIVIRDISCDIYAENVAIGKHEYALHVEAEVVTASGDNTPIQIRKMIADIYKAINTDTGGYKGEKWSGLAQRTELEGDEITTNQAGKTIGGAQVKFAVIFRTDRLNPYA